MDSDYQKEYYQKNKERVLKKTNEYKRNNKDHIRQKNEESKRKIHRVYKGKLFIARAINYAVRDCKSLLSGFRIANPEELK